MKKYFKYITTNRLILFLASLGILLSFYLWSVQVADPKDAVISCAVGDGCYQVLTGPYGKLWGIPMSVFGVFYYVFVLFTAFLREKINDKLLSQILVLEVVWGIIFSLYLRFVEFYYIRHICSWCWLSVLIVIILTVVLYIEKKKVTSD